MEISAPKTMDLENKIQFLKEKNANFLEVAEELFSYNYQDFNSIFKIDEVEIPTKTYIRKPIFNGNCVGILMLWGIGNKTAIHDHKNYNGKIKVLKGNLTEISYRETGNFIEYDGEGIANEGVDFDEDFGGIHSIVNNDDDFSVSLHVYQTAQLNLNGVRIFDLENKKIGFLNEKAPFCTWELPEEAFEHIISL